MKFLFFFTILLIFTTTSCTHRKNGLRNSDYSKYETKSTVIDKHSIKDFDLNADNSDDLSKESNITFTNITFIGDSIMKGSEHIIKKMTDNSFIDASVSRQFTALPNILENLNRRNQLNDLLIIHLGSNGLFTDKAFDDSMKIIGERKVIFINCGLDRDWENSINKKIENKVSKYQNASILDWYSIVRNNKNILGNDGAHPTIEGRKVYTNLIFTYIKNLRRSK